VSKLFLSHNNLETLQGIEQFKALTHLSVSHNSIQDIEELSKLENASLLECLAVKGNWIDRNPDYKALIIQYFPNLKDLDGLQVTTLVRQQIKDGEVLKRQLMCFLYKFD
jgi:hypothetical protein